MIPTLGRFQARHRQSVLHFSRSYASTREPREVIPKILIANRGEIACRVIRTARRLGIKTVSVYSDADANSLHVKMADEAVRIGPPPSAESYLNLNAIIDAVQKTGAMGVHPGYGFLSENPLFPDTLSKIGVKFIGPSGDSMRALGDKIESKKLAIGAGVSVVPGRGDPLLSPEQAVEVAHEIGYPILIKASRGGGGKGQRICWNDQEVTEGWRLCRQEAKSSFATDTVFMEKFIQRPRHIEFQLLADSFGNTVYFPERECSIQRRNQKVFEETPSVFVTESIRRQMGQQAAALAKASGYESAGTVEFLMDADKNWYFLEMNTRLQVEHPISEMVTGQDIVEHMIRIAAGETLSVKQADLSPKGWATETRVYAEDPSRNFLPSIGTLKTYIEPLKISEDPNDCVRIDTGVREGSEISIYYDPVISKLISYGKDRARSIALLSKALDSYVIEGVSHNISFLRTIVDNEKYKSGDLTTNFLKEVYPGGFKSPMLGSDAWRRLLCATAVVHSRHLERSKTITDSYEIPIHDREQDAMPEWSAVVSITQSDGSTLQGSISVLEDVDSDTLAVMVDNNEENMMTVHSDWDMSSPVVSMSVGGDEDFTVQSLLRKPGGYILRYRGIVCDISVLSKEMHGLLKYMPLKEKADTSRFVLAPMSGSVFSVAVKPGDVVIAGQEVVVVEAMKMQNVVRSEKDGKIKSVKVNPGTLVSVDAVMIEYEG